MNLSHPERSNQISVDQNSSDQKPADQNSSGQNPLNQNSSVQNVSDQRLVNALFLDALKASLEDRQVDWDCEKRAAPEGAQDAVSVDTIYALLHMAQLHNILPMIYQAIYGLPAFGQMDEQDRIALKREVHHDIALQARKTAEFRLLYDHLRKGGVTPCVVKGIICRNLYPHPDDRMSSDEDVLVHEKQFKRAHALMLEYGMQVTGQEEDIGKAYEVPYGKAGSPLYIEMHRILFPEESEAYGDLNRYFRGIHERLVVEEIQGTKFLTMNRTDHLFYLICHAFKHFLHSGFGIRQVCDMTLFANAYGEDINWYEILEKCCEIHADLFVAAIFKIGKRYLTFDEGKACYPAQWSEIEVDETDLLEDLLASGVYGQAKMSRKHSSNMTLNAVAEDKRGKKAKKGAWGAALSSVFLPAGALEKRYPYLKKYPFLLPAAWTQRVWSYRKEISRASKDNNAADSIRIGRQRIDLMKKYGIIR